MHSHLDALQAMRPVGLRRLASEVHSVAKQASFYIALGTHFQGFWSAKWLPKFDFWGFFFDVIFHCVWASNFGRFFEAPNQKNSDFPRENNDFRKNCVFDKNAQIARCCLRFRRPKRRKSIQNSNPKTYYLKHWIWRLFPCILGAFWSPKIIKKSQMFEKIDARRRPL